MNAQICEEFFLTLLYSLEITDSLCLMYPQSALSFPTQYDAPIPGKVCGEVMESLQGEARARLLDEQRLRTSLNSVIPCFLKEGAKGIATLSC